MATFGDRLRRLRTENNLTQDDLAEIFHKTKATISNYETGRYEPSLDIIIDLADHFNVSIDFLMGRTDRPHEIPGEALSKELKELIDNGDIKYIDAIKDAKQQGLSPEAVQEIIKIFSDLDKFKNKE